MATSVNSIQLADAKQLFERYGGQVLARCQHLLRDPSAAQDATQEVFVRLLRGGGDFRGECEWMTWLYRVATNVCLTRLRDESRRGDSWLAEMQSTLPETSPSAEDAVVNRAMIRTVLEGRDEVDQQLVVLLFLDGLSQGEAASVLGMSRATINKRVQDMRQAYRMLEAS